MRRREVFRGLAGLAAALTGGSLLVRGREARAFGETPPAARAAMLPDAERAQNVLEIFLCGGVSQYESFYCVPEHGKADRTHYHLYEASAEMASALQACGLSGAPSEYFANDALGQEVHLGPFALPLRQRPDVKARTRVSIMRHELAPHEAAIPLSLSGRTLGNPALAGLGAHVQRYFAERDGGLRGPVSYVLTSNSIGQLPIDNLRALVATGLHPAAARPLDVKVDAKGDLAQLLARSAVGSSRAAWDALAEAEAARYGKQLSWPASSARLRAPAYDDFQAGSRWLRGVDGIGAALAPDSWRLAEASACGQTTPSDAVGAQLRLAAHLLTDVAAEARYVCVVDGGFIPVGNGGGGYDSHADNTAIQSRNLFYTLKALLDLVKLPGEDAPQKLDLSRTLILLTTEFGRSPSAEGSSGRSHWPYGYATAMLGGPITRSGVFGACDANGYGSVFATPQQTRVAALLALGIWPFTPEGFNLADVPGASSEPAAAVRVLEQQLGLQV